MSRIEQGPWPTHDEMDDAPELDLDMAVTAGELLHFLRNDHAAWATVRGALTEFQQHVAETASPEHQADSSTQDAV